jgi:DNA-binding XRE family transcriptional regulator
VVRTPNGDGHHRTWQPCDPDHGGLRRAAPWVYRVVVYGHDQPDPPLPLAPLRAARQHAGLAQRQLAALLGVCAATVSRWETGDGPIPADAYLRWLTACADHTGTSIHPEGGTA